MYVIVRSLFWIGIVVLLLPVGGDTQFRTGDAVEAARSAVADLSGFCDRNPATCETSSHAVSAFGHKMAEGAKWAYAMVQDRPYEPATAVAVADRTVRTVPFDRNGPVGARELAEAPAQPPVPGGTRVLPSSEPNTTILQRGTLTEADRTVAWQAGQRI